MGKSQGELKRERKANISRRRFLRNLGMGFGALVAASLGGISLSDYFNQKERWAFLGRPDVRLEDNWEVVFANYVPLCPRIDLENKRPEEYREFIARKSSAIAKDIREKGFTIPKQLVYSQYFGRPEDPEIAERYKEYAIGAIDYLYKRLPKLERVPLELEVVKWGQDFSGIKTGKAFIGQTRHYITMADVSDDIQKRGFRNAEISSNDGSHSYMEYSAAGEREKYFVFLSSSFSQLDAPIVEILHLSTSRAAHFYNLRGGRKRWETEEAVAHGISTILAEEFARIMKVPSYQEHIKRGRSKEKNYPQYELIDASIDWLRKNGIEQGLALYMEDPGKYLEAITGGR